jgi:hypothetical protein
LRNWKLPLIVVSLECLMIMKENNHEM